MWYGMTNKQILGANEGAQDHLMRSWSTAVKFKSSRENSTWKVLKREEKAWHMQGAKKKSTDLKVESHRIFILLLYPLFFIASVLLFFFLSKLYIQCGVWTHDSKIKSRMLYWLPARCPFLSLI